MQQAKSSPIVPYLSVRQPICTYRADNEEQLKICAAAEKAIWPQNQTLSCAKHSDYARHARHQSDRVWCNTTKSPRKAGFSFQYFDQTVWLRGQDLNLRPGL